MRAIDVFVLLLVTACGMQVIPCGGQIQPLSGEVAAGALPGLEKVGFEEFRLDDLYPPPTLGNPGLANPLKYAGLTIMNPGPLSGGFCSAPTCLPDPENPYGGNTSLFLVRGASLSFDALPQTVVLDVQGIGDNPFTLEVVDGSGAHEQFDRAGLLFGRTLAGFSSDAGVRRVEVKDVRGTGGPLALAGVYFTIPEPGATTLMLGGGCLLVASANRRRLASGGSTSRP